TVTRAEVRFAGRNAPRPDLLVTVCYKEVATSVAREGASGRSGRSGQSRRATGGAGAGAGGRGGGRRRARRARRRRLGRLPRGCDVRSRVRLADVERVQAQLLLAPAHRLLLVEDDVRWRLAQRLHRRLGEKDGVGRPL